MSKAHTALDEVATTGAFERKESAWRNWIRADGSTQFAPERGRYHLYVSLACPWACRTLAARKLKGLEDVISYTVVHPVWVKTKPDDPEDSHRGWAFVSAEGEFSRCSPCPEGHKTIREIYEKAGDTLHKYSVPVLWDKKLNTIVNNESSEILRMFDSEFNEFAKNPTLSLYPEPLRAEIDELNAWIYPGINNGVYRAGFATKQEPYEEAIRDVYAALDRVEEILSRQRYLAGRCFTEADVRLFVTLVRFDQVYVVHFKCNRKRIGDYPNITNYVREIYQIPGIAETVDMENIKNHYYRSHPQINPHGIVAAGPEVDFDRPHDRARFEADPLGL